MERLKLVDPKLQAASPQPAAGYTQELLHGDDKGEFCVYNLTRGCFLGVEVEAADFSATALDERFPALAPGCGFGLWLIPFRGISPVGVRIPFDLLYLDRNSVVTDVVESFPIFRASSSSPLADSLLALPARTISSTQTQSGDQLMICTPNEMKRHLERLARAALEGGPLPAAPAPQHSAPAQDESNQGVSGGVLQFEDRPGQEPSGQDMPPEEAVPYQVPVAVPALEPQAAPPAEPAGKPEKSWLERWLSLEPDEPVDPRQFLREPIPGLVAHFFTGGVPQEHQIRDVSLTGLYVLTNERWYPGTVVRMTLTDRREPTAERSITVNATVVRWGNDGLGLRFVLQNPRTRRSEFDGVVQGVDRVQLEQFLQRLKGGAV
jgi:uncharacterized protein